MALEQSVINVKVPEEMIALPGDLASEKVMMRVLEYLLR